MQGGEISEDMLYISWRLKRRISSERRKLREMRELIESLSKEIDGLPRGDSKVSRVESLSVAIIDLERTIAALKMVRVECIAELGEMLNVLVEDDNQRAVLMERYGYCQLFRDIGIRLGYSETHVYYLHRCGLKQINSKIIV